MLNINQNFDLKAPVFNFDRDYFNSVDELNAYDTSNVPDHFVTNVAGMLYQFTDGKWLPIIGTTSNNNSNLSIGKGSMFISGVNTNSPSLEIRPHNTSANASFHVLGIDFINTDKRLILGSSSPSITMISNQCNSAFSTDCMHITHTNKCKMSLNLKDAEAEEDNYTPNMQLINDGYTASIHAENGFTHKTDDGFTSNLSGYGFSVGDELHEININNFGLQLYTEDTLCAEINLGRKESSLTFGSDEKFKISRPVDNSEGAVISGIKSLTAFANPSATKVWATDGSTIDVLLKKNASGGYYIESNSHELGSKAFAANSTCTASGQYSHAEGCLTNAIGQYSHAEGGLAKAIGQYSHAEGQYTEASGFGAHAQGTYNIDNKNAIHSVGIGNSTTKKNAEYIYVKDKASNTSQIDDPKNGYKYLIGVGGYDGISTDNTTYKSVQEVIADLTSRIEQLETKVRALEAANTPA